MPWTKKDVDRHKKGLTDEQKKTWVKVANSALKRCQAKGGEDCEASAIRQANSVIGEQKESAMTYKAYTTSTNNVLISVNAIDVDGEAIPVGELVAAYTGTLTNMDGPEEEQVEISDFTEAVAGSLEDYAMSVKDAFRIVFKPVTVSSGIEIGSELWPRDVFKDNLDLGDVVVVRDDGNLYAVEYNETDEGFEFATRENWRKVVLTYVPVKEETAEMAEAQLSESASGHAIGLAEAQAVTDGPRAPLLMDVALITPGWGNKKDNHYYSPEVLRRDAWVFEGVKMYATDHRPGEKSVKTEVSVIKQIKDFTDDGAPIAQVAVHDPDFAEATRNRAKLGTLSSLECSILATGRTKKGRVNDRKGNIVEAITSATSVDWVTKAGAGGHAIALAESNTGGEQVAEEEQVTQQQETEEESQEATLTEDGGEEEITYLAESEIKEMLEASRLPRQAQGRLAEGQYLDTDALKAAIEQERQYIKEITGSGKPFAQGDSIAPGEEQMSEADYDVAYADILRRHGLHVPQQEVT